MHDFEITRGSKNIKILALHTLTHNSTAGRDSHTHHIKEGGGRREDWEDCLYRVSSCHYSIMWKYKEKVKKSGLYYQYCTILK